MEQTIETSRDIQYYFEVDKISPITNQSDYIIQTVCDYFKVDRRDIVTASRKREFVTARHLCMYFLHVTTGQTLDKIGSYFGDRHHSTILHAIDTVRNLKEFDKKYRADFERLNIIINL